MTALALPTERVTGNPYPSLALSPPVWEILTFEVVFIKDGPSGVLSPVGTVLNN